MAAEAQAREAWPGEAFGAVFGSRGPPVHRPVAEIGDSSRAGLRAAGRASRRMEEIRGKGAA